MIDGREFITVQRRISDLDNDVVTRKQFKHLWHAASRGEIRNKKSGASSPTDLHDAILWRPRRPKTVHSAYAHVGTELRPDACPEARVRPAPNRYQHVLDDGRPPPLRSRQPTRFGLLLARYRVQLTGGLVSLLVLIPARIRSRMAHDGHQWPANIEFGDVSHTWPRWHSHVSLLRMFLYWVGVTQQKGAASDPF